MAHFAAGAKSLSSPRRLLIGRLNTHIALGHSVAPLIGIVIFAA
jgi:hypothetical protein